MEVHPPEHAIHSWRDFLIHMGTITLGLLIALALEGLVEHLHHRHLVHTARENIRGEMLANQVTLQRDVAALREVNGQLEADVQTLRALQNHDAAPDPKLVSGWTWYGLSTSAHDTARETGALALMDYAEVQRIEQTYTQQRYVENAANAYIRDVTMIQLPLQGGRLLRTASAVDLQRMLDSSSASLLDAELIGAFARGLDGDYHHALHAD